MQEEKTKVGILTFHYSTNPGSLLQAYALKKRLEKEADCVEIINYSSRKQLDKLTLAQYKRKYRYLAGCRFVANKAMNAIKDIHTGRQCRTFRKKYLDISSGAIEYDDSNIMKLANRYDYFVAGSDQIWNVQNRRFSYTYLLDFVKDDRKKLSYAPSLSAEVDMSDVEEEKFVQALRGFTTLSAREREGSEYISRLTGRPCETVLDPTLLFDGAFWKKLITGRKPPGEEYLFVYLRSNDPAISRIASRLSKEGHKVLITPKKEYSDRTGNMVVDIAPQEWLNLICHSQCVITNSFHGLVFSVLLKKDFWVKVIPGAKTNSRLQNLLSSLGLENRLIADSEEIDLSRHVDYEAVDQRLKALREQSEAYIHSFGLRK